MLQKIQEIIAKIVNLPSDPMFMNYIILLAGVLGVALLTILFKGIIFRKKDTKVLRGIFRVLIIVYMVLEFFTLFIPDVLSWRYSNDELATMNYSLVAILRWLNELAFVTLPFALFFKNKRIINKMVAFVVLPVALLQVVFLYKIMPTWNEAIEPAGIGALHFLKTNTLEQLLINPKIRLILFTVMTSIEVGCCLFVIFDNKGSFKFKNVYERIFFLIQLLFLVVTMMPTYALQHIFHTRSLLFMKPYTVEHLLWVVEIIIEIIVVTSICKKQSYEDRYILVFTLSLALLLQYHQMFNMLGEITASRLPLQLCNIASYLLILTLLTKSDKLYHFTLVANVLGAILAIALLNNDPQDGFFQPMNWHYIMEHQNVIVAPILMLTLRLFKPLENKDYKDIVIAWTIYFVLVLGLGTFFMAKYAQTGDAWFKCNYFFMFDPEKAGQFLPFTVPLFGMQAKFNEFYNLKLVQPIMYVAFLALFAIVFFIMKWTSSKKHKKELRRHLIKM